MEKFSDSLSLSSHSQTMAALAIWDLIKNETVPMVFDQRMHLMSSLFCITIIPALDLASDTVYLFYSVWATNTMFTVATLAFFLPMVIFCDHLYKCEVYPMMYFGRPPDWVFLFTEMNSLPAVIITGITTLPWTLVNLPIILAIFSTGYVLYSTKLLAMRPVRNTWMRVWSGTDKFDTVEPIDMAVLNHTKYAELWIETVPQLILQIFNATLMDTWTDFGIISVCVSVPICVSAVYRWVFYVYNRGMKVVDIPTGLEWYVEMQQGDRGDGANATKKLVTGTFSAGMIGEEMDGPHMQGPQMENTFDRDSDDEDKERDKGDVGGATAATATTTSSPLHGASESTEIELMEKRITRSIDIE